MLASRRVDRKSCDGEAGSAENLENCSGCDGRFDVLHFEEMLDFVPDDEGRRSASTPAHCWWCWAHWPKLTGRRRQSTPRRERFFNTNDHDCQRHQTRHIVNFNGAPCMIENDQRAEPLGPRRGHVLQVPGAEPDHQAEGRHHAPRRRVAGRGRFSEARRQVHVRRRDARPLPRRGRLRAIFAAPRRPDRRDCSI